MAEEVNLFKLETLDRALQMIAEAQAINYSSFKYSPRGYGERLVLSVTLSKNGWNRDLIIDGAVASSDVMNEFLAACSDLTKTLSLENELSMFLYKPKDRDEIY